MGSIVEWFDVAVYGYLATEIGRTFFPSESSTVSLLSSLAVFGAAFAVRPLGGIFFGGIGDRHGRRTTLAWILLLVAGSTLLIGLLPGYNVIGVISPILLVLFRLLQGFSAGGEMGGASAFVAEYSPPESRGYHVSWVEMGCILGFLLGSLVVLLLKLSLTQSTFESWGWRIPFILAAPLGTVGLYVRTRLDETPEFAELKQKAETAEHPLRDSVLNYWPSILRTAGYALFQNAALYIVLTLMPSYQTDTLKYGSVTASVSSVVSMAVTCAVIPVFGALSDRVGRRPILGLACVAAVLVSYPLFVLMGQGNVALAIVSHVGLGLILGIFLGPTLAAMNELFITRVRFGGFSIGYNISVSAFGGTAPFIVTGLIALTGHIAAMPSLYTMAAAAVTLVVVITAKETAPRRIKSVKADETG